MGWLGPHTLSPIVDDDEDVGEDDDDDRGVADDDDLGVDVDVDVADDVDPCVAPANGNKILSILKGAPL